MFSHEAVLRRKCEMCAVQITYLTSIKCSSSLNVISAKSAENTTQGDQQMYLISRYKRLRLNIREIEFSIKTICKVFNFKIQKSSRFFNLNVAKSLSMFISFNCSIKMNLAYWLKLCPGSL